MGRKKPGPSEREPYEEESSSDVAVDEADPEVSEPPKYVVLLLNDDYTTMEFVIEVLTRFFRKTNEEAMQIMLKVHTEGKGIAGIYSREIAETKALQVNEYAKSHRHPLKCTAEPA